jgi:hypothetical protein
MTVTSIVIVVGSAALMFAARLNTLRRVWRLPLKNGERFFLAQQVPTDFYRAAGVRLFRRYHRAIVVPVVLDLPLALWLVLTHRYVALTLEQVVALVGSIVAYNFMAAYFSARATSLCDDQGRPTNLQLSMEPRRLRDHTTAAVEVVIVVATLLALGLLARDYRLSQAAGAGHWVAHILRGGLLLTVWVLYWQLGFLLLKVVFVRWRMPLPVNRTEDFRRWRTAWLSHTIKTLDAVRLLSALVLLACMAYGHQWSRAGRLTVLGVGIVGMLVYAAYVGRESRRLAAAERELRPVEMVKEFPRWPIAEGLYLAGGLFYFNRDNPRVLVRSADGIALNLAHRTTYIGFAYFMGLIAVVIWMVRLTS